MQAWSMKIQAGAYRGLQDQLNRMDTMDSLTHTKTEWS